MDDSRSVVVFGSINMDLSIEASRMPAVGETVLGRSFVTTPGGKGANQAVAAARMGAPTYMIGAVGEDAFGDTLVENLVEAGVDCTHVQRSSAAATGVAMIVRVGGDNRIVVSAGANMVRTGDDAVRALDELIASGVVGVGSVLLAQGECSLAATAQVIMHAHKRGLYTIFNPAPACDLPDEAWREVDLVCLNETECEALTGIAPHDEQSCREALEMLNARTGGNSVITLGGAGSVNLGEEGYFHVPACARSVVDATAAGDTYLGAFAAARAAWFPVVDAMGPATFAASIAVSRLGAQQSIPTEQEVWEWIAQAW